MFFYHEEHEGYEERKSFSRASAQAEHIGIKKPSSFSGKRAFY
jgi:hypothetical protein